MVNEFPKHGIHLIGQLVQRTESELNRIPNTGLTSIKSARDILAGHSLRFGMELEGWDDAEALVRRKQLGRQILRILSEHDGKSSEPAACLEDEMLGLLQLVETERNVKLLASLHGFDGTAPKTLEEVGQANNLTRERVRQLSARAQLRLSKLWHPTPRLAAAIQLLLDVEPCDADAASAALANSGISRGPFHPEAVIEAAEILKTSARIKRFVSGSDVFFALPSSKVLIRQIVFELRRATSAAGCTSVERLALVADLPIEHADRVRRLLCCLSETVWLDGERTWVMSDRPTRNRLINYAEKVFVAVEKVGLIELRRSLSRPHRLDYVPSAEAVAAIVERNGLARREGDHMMRLRMPGVERLGVNDGAILTAFQRLGSPLSREQLEEACIDESGVNENSFYIHLSYSPLVSKLSTGVYALVGADVAVGSVEKLRAGKIANRIASEHGWTSNGKLWCTASLDRVSAKMGNRALPSYVANLTNGTWSSFVVGNLTGGEVRVENGFISGLRGIFSLLGTEANDFVRFTFDFNSRAVEIRVGDAELCEADDSLTDFQGDEEDEDPSTELYSDEFRVDD